MYMSYDLSHYLEGDISQSTSFTVSDDDAINCAHMLAAGFNTISRKMMGDFVLAVADTKAGTVQYDGKIEKIDRADKRRDLLESAYAELERVKNVLFDAGVETIPADAGVRDLLAVKRAMSDTITRRDESIVDLSTDLASRDGMNEAARVELIEHVKRAYAKWDQVDPGRQREELKSHLRGMLEVLSKFLAATGEADADERHAVALRVCEIPEGNYLYDDA